MTRGLIAGIEDRELILTQITNSDHEHVVLKRYPFHEAPTRMAAQAQYSLAVRLMFQIVPEEHWHAVMGRFNRKLIKRMQHFYKLEQRNRNATQRPD